MFAYTPHRFFLFKRGVIQTQKPKDLIVLSTPPFKKPLFCEKRGNARIVLTADQIVLVILEFINYDE
jgi:hypothetical protein